MRNIGCELQRHHPNESKASIAACVEQKFGVANLRLCAGCGRFLRAAANSDAIRCIPGLAEVFREEIARRDDTAGQPPQRGVTAPSSVHANGPTPPVDPDELRQHLVRASGFSPEALLDEVRTPHARELMLSLLPEDHPRHRFVGDGDDDGGDDDGDVEMDDGENEGDSIHSEMARHVASPVCMMRRANSMPAVHPPIE